MTQPTLFVSHGSPMLALTRSPAQQFLQRLGAELPRPEGVVVVSAHFASREPAVVTDPHPETVYDFGGFPAELYQITYPAPGDPELAADVARLVGKAGLPVAEIAERGFDHGTWVPLSLIWPAADVPIVQLSMQPHQNAAHHLTLGRAIASLRERDVLVVGTGTMTHNLRELMTGGMKPIDAAPEEWAIAFADWIADRTAAGAVEDLVHYRERAPSAVRAHPSDDHFLPFFVALGAAGEGAKGKRIHASIEYGALAMDAYRFG
jgi:4,5-DOPA dioxygenase extradiol